MINRAPPRVDFLGVAFDPLNAVDARRVIVDLSQADCFSYVVTPNVDHIVQLKRASDPAFAAAYDDATLLICDSRILSRLAFLSGLKLTPVPGSDITRDLLAEDLPACSIAVVGGNPDLQHVLTSLYPRFSWSFHVPPMGVRTNPDAQDAIAAFVEARQADVVLFAIGAPQSEMICSEISARGHARGVALCTGASLEFLSGAKQRAPRWMQRAGLEWLHRLMSEPRRLGRRYLIEGPQIFAIWWRWHRLNSRRVRSGSIPSDAS